MTERAAGLPRKERLRRVVRGATVALFVGVGLAHFTHVDLFVGIMPPWLPWHRELVWTSGIFEVMGGVGLIPARTRRWASFGLMALLVAVFPANVHMAIHHVPFGDLPADPVALWARLPLQAVLLLQVWWVGGGGPRRSP